jgi:hypothetical protein
LNFHNFAYTLFVVFDVPNALVIFDYSAHAEIQAAKDDFLLNVLDESQNVGVNLQSVCVTDVAVDKPVSNALPSVG